MSEWLFVCVVFRQQRLTCSILRKIKRHILVDLWFAARSGSVHSVQREFLSIGGLRESKHFHTLYPPLGVSHLKPLTSPPKTIKSPPPPSHPSFYYPTS